MDQRKSKVQHIIVKRGVLTYDMTKKSKNNEGISVADPG